MGDQKNRLRLMKTYSDAYLFLIPLSQTKMKTLPFSNTRFISIIFFLSFILFGISSQAQGGASLSWNGIDFTPLGGSNVIVGPTGQLKAVGLDHSGNQGFAVDPDGDSLVSFIYDTIPWPQAPQGASLTHRVRGRRTGRTPQVLMDVTIRKQWNGLHVNCANTSTPRFDATIAVCEDTFFYCDIPQTAPQFVIENAPEAITITPLSVHQGIETSIFSCINNCTIRIANQVYIGNRIEVRQSNPIGIEEVESTTVTGRNIPYILLGDLNLIPLNPGINQRTTYAIPESFAAFSLVPYPNPAKDQVTVKMSQAPQAVQLYNLRGESFPIRTEWTQNGLRVMGLADLSAGLYMLTVETGQAIYHAKVVKK